MITNFTVFASPDIDLGPPVGQVARPPGQPYEIPSVDPSWLAPSPLLDAVLHPRDVELRLADKLEAFEPLTVCELAHRLSLSIARVEEAIAVCESGRSFRVVKRWVDMTRYGRGVEFIGTCGRLGLVEPDGPVTTDGQLPKVDPRTVLSIIRSEWSIGLAALAKRLLVPQPAIEAVVIDLTNAGHVLIRKRGQSIWAYAIHWPDQQPKRPKAKAKAKIK